MSEEQLPSEEQVVVVKNSLVRVDSVSPSKDNALARIREMWRRWQALSGWNQEVLENRWLLAGEWLLIVLWALRITAPYLDMEPAMVPTGREYLSAIQTHHLWTEVLECGTCAFWNGHVRGGAPAFVDPHGSMLHPLVILMTLGWGVLNGAKLALAASFIMAGLAQWWLAKVLGVGREARLWSACMAVAAGHLAGRMELGAFGVVLSTAACMLVLPPVIILAQTGSRRAAVLLGIMLALAAVAGQGYMQIGLLLTLPAILILISWEQKAFSLLAQRFMLAAVIAFLLAAVFLIPFLHFLPQFVKEVDATFESAQPLAYIPLNLVINEHDFFTSTSLDKLPYPHLNVNYVGWVPILLALFALGNYRDRRIIFLIAQACLAFWIASAIPLRWLFDYLPFQGLRDLVAGIRHPSQIAGLAILPILGLAAIGLDRLLRATWPELEGTLTTHENSKITITFSLRWLLLLPLLFALIDARTFGQRWISTIHIDSGVEQVLESLQTPDLQWVAAPFGEHFYTESAIDMRLKLASGIRTWNWRDRLHPKAVLEASHLGPPVAMSPQSEVNGVTIYRASSGREYATVLHSDTTVTVCTAEGLGGQIEIRCDLPQAGLLTVKENSWSGWRATIDNQSVALEANNWLTVEVPAGQHTIQFRYQPWDVPLGIILTLVGVGLALYLWQKGDGEVLYIEDSSQDRPSSNTLET